ncbi:MAG: MBL fold metallo-hydrolase [Planctomycetota bacterium]|jgi:glyoxylase-like metal-dependent hydrolase (beta-lactamase superfamily II)|nr:MBL fold metallo-hydrolase [Planctomycetota bacterium]
MTHLFVFCFALPLLLFASADRSGAAEPEARAVKYRLGEATVWAIADSLGDRQMNVFAGADPEALKRYAPSGASPSAIMVFAVQIAGSTILIDSGLGAVGGERASRLPAGLARAGIDPAKVELVLVTHMHGDHIGGLLRDGQRAFPNAVVKIGRIEGDFWLSDRSMAADPSRKANFELARQVAKAYAGALEYFEFGDEPAPGFLAVDAIGHTPGHTAFLLESGGERLFFIGDLLHAAALQFPRPDINASYDMIPEMAAAARRRLLERAVRERLPVAGMHLPFAGVGRVEDAGEGGFAYRPWSD